LLLRLHCLSHLRSVSPCPSAVRPAPVHVHVQVGSNSYEAAVGWIREQFECRNLDPASKTIYTHITCATDTSNVTAVFSAVKDIILRKNLGKVRRRGAGRGKGCADGPGGRIWARVVGAVWWCRVGSVSSWARARVCVTLLQQVGLL